MTRAVYSCLFAILLASACTTVDEPDAVIVVSVIGTNDVHGNLSRRDDRGGLTTISGYVGALRAARSDDGGAVLLVDAGDMWQGTLESNLTEGAAVVAAYNALGYAAAAVGNHEFDFGPLGPDAIASNGSDDPRGALKQRAIEANFPFLAANLIDATTNKPVNWPNFHPSVMIDANGLSIGVIGVMTKKAMETTIAANVHGLHVAPLAAAIETQAESLRAAGADLVIVAAHAGSRCERFDDPYDLSSCDEAGEIFAVARSLPTGLVDHIIAGHVHQGIAHVVNGISITSSYSNTVAFSRVDFVLDATTLKVTNRRVFPPTEIAVNSIYEGRALRIDADVIAIAERATQFAMEQKNRPVGIYLDTPFTLEGNPESTLGNLFTDAMLASFDVDVAIHNVAGGLRQDLPGGDLTYGNVYEMSPFENRVVIIRLSGAELRRIVAEQALRGSRSMGFSGMRASITCSAGEMLVALDLDGGSTIADNDQIEIVVNDYIAFGGDGILTSVLPDDGYPIDTNLPLTRDAFVQWLSDQGGSIAAESFASRVRPKWIRPDLIGSECNYANAIVK